MRLVSTMLAGVVVIAGLSCFSRVPNERFKQRVTTIDALYEDSIDEIERAYERELDAIEAIAEHLIQIEPDANNEPEDPVATQPHLSRLAKTCDDLGREALSSQDAALLQAYGDCTNKHMGVLIAALVSTYWAADIDWIAKAFVDRPEELDLESLFVYSHNMRLRAFVAERKQQARRARRDALAELERVRAHAVTAARQMRELEIEENRRTFNAALAVAAQSFLQSRPSHERGTTSSQLAPYGTVQVTNTRPACASDYDCRFGQHCVQENYSVNGFCAETVNEHGVPTYGLPRTESLMVKMPAGTDCDFDTDCPVGFRCHERTGACVR